MKKRGFMLLEKKKWPDPNYRVRAVCKAYDRTHAREIFNFAYGVRPSDKIFKTPLLPKDEDDFRGLPIPVKVNPDSIFSD